MKSVWTWGQKTAWRTKTRGTDGGVGRKGSEKQEQGVERGRKEYQKRSKLIMFETIQLWKSQENVAVLNF